MKYIDAEKLIERLEEMKRAEYENCGGVNSKTGALQEVQELITSLQQEQPKERLIQVKCLYPYDESWQKNKVYTCEVWHHGDLNRDFWDVYYDYGKDPRYVQFTSIELLNEEFVVIHEQPEVDLEKEWKSYMESRKDDLSGNTVTVNMKDLARHFYELGLNARKED